MMEMADQGTGATAPSSAPRQSKPMGVNRFTKAAPTPPLDYLATNNPAAQGQGLTAPTGPNTNSPF